MKSTYQYIIYTKPEKKCFSGILGEIDFYSIDFLFAGGKYLIEEQYDGNDPIEWYKAILEEQDIFIKSSKKQKYKNKNFIWFEVDSEKTAISQFTNWTELESSDNTSLAWRKIYYPCSKDTITECLGLAVVAREIILSPKNKLSLKLSDLLDSILKSYNLAATN
jgi:hypothetical protein